MLNVAVLAKTLMSPVQPSRSSRAGVSVGMDRKLPRCPQVMLLCSLFTMALEVSNSLVSSPSVCMTRPVTVDRSGVPG